MRKVVGTMIVTLCVGLLTQGAEPEPRRLAVLEVEGAEKDTSALVPLLEAKLLEKSDRVVLLERSSVDRLLREQELGLSNAGEFGGKSAIRAGKLWGVDVFCLLQMTERNLRVQMVDAWYGLKVLDLTLPMPRANEMEKTAAQLAVRIGQQLSAVARDPKGMRLVGVLDFRSMEPTNRLDALVDKIHASLEQQMMFQPGVVVVERRQVQPLLDERELVPGMAEGIRASMLLLDGEFRLDENDEDQLVVYVQARKNEDRIFTVKVTGPKEGVQELGAQLALAIRGKMDEVASGNPMSQEAEAEMLVKQAKATSDPVLALSAMAAARALMPESDEYHRAYLAEQYKWNHRVPLSLAQFRRYVYESRDVVDYWLTKPDFSVQDEIKWPSSQVFQCANMWVKYEDVPKEIHEEISRLLYEMFYRCWERGVLSEELTGPDLQRHLEYDLKTFNLIGVTDEDKIFKFYTELSRYAKERVMLSVTNQLVWPKSFSEEQTFAKSEQFYIWLRDREDPFLRMCGKRGLARIYACAGEKEKYRKARKLYEDFEEEFLFEYLPGVGEETASSIIYINGLPWWIFPFLDSKGFYQQPKVAYFADEKKNLNYRAEHAMRVMKQVFTDPRCPQRVNWFWSGQLPRVLGQAERFADQAEALRLSIAYQQRGLEVYQGNNEDHKRWTRVHISDSERMLNALLTEHPKLLRQEETVRDPNYKPAKILPPGKAASGDESPGSPYRLVIANGMTAVLGSKGALFLDQETLAPLRFEAVPSGGSVGGHIATDDTGIYTVSRSGIVFFPRKGSARVFFRDHPELGMKCRGIDVLNNRIYMLAGSSSVLTSEGLLEFNLSTGERTVLLTSKAQVREQVIAHLSGIFMMFTVPERNRLYIILQRHHGDEYGAEAFWYEPETGVYDSADKPWVVPYVWRVQRRGNKLISWFSFGVCEVSLTSEYPKLAWYKTDEHRFEFYKSFTRIGKGFVGIHKGDLHYFPEPGTPLQKIKYKIFPLSEGKAPYLVDLATHPDLGLLLLTSDGIYSVPGLQHTKEDNL